jgi:hypothetical protein
MPWLDLRNPVEMNPRGRIMSTSLISWLNRVTSTPVSTFDKNDIGALWLLANDQSKYMYLEKITSYKRVVR